MYININLCYTVFLLWWKQFHWTMLSFASAVKQSQATTAAAVAVAVATVVVATKNCQTWYFIDSMHFGCLHPHKQTEPSVKRLNGMQMRSFLQASDTHTLSLARSLARIQTHICILLEDFRCEKSLLRIRYSNLVYKISKKVRNHCWLRKMLSTRQQWNYFKHLLLIFYLWFVEFFDHAVTSLSRFHPTISKMANFKNLPPSIRWTNSFQFSIVILNLYWSMRLNSIVMCVFFSACTITAIHSHCVCVVFDYVHRHLIKLFQLVR